VRGPERLTNDPGATPAHHGRTSIMVSSSFSTTCTTVCGPIVLTQVLAPGGASRLLPNYGAQYSTAVNAAMIAAIIEAIRPVRRRRSMASHAPPLEHISDTWL
jgi:hypothetical protein